MAYRKDWISLIRQLAPKYKLDPRALLAVASAEGLSGGVGDSGHAFGPFQLNDAGGVITGRPGDHRAFAESPAGIEWALQQIASVAGGEVGKQAVNSIVRRFERPADPDSEVSRALGAYGSFGGGTVEPPTPTVSPAPAPEGQPTSQPEMSAVRSQLARALMSKERPDWLALALAKRNAETATPEASAIPPSKRRAVPPPSPTTRTPRGALAEAFYDPLGSYDNGRFGGPIGHHSDHVHLSVTDAKAMLAAIGQAKRMGLHVGENPYVDPVDPVHVKDSFHFRDFPGRYNGRRLGEAIDVSGNKNLMADYYRWATRNLR